MTQPSTDTRKIEIAYTRGFNSTQKRKIFANEAAFVKWLDKNHEDVEVLATTDA